DAIAQSNLGVMYKNGKGVLKDYNEAVKWFRLSAEQGNASAQNNLGVMYDTGKGVLQDNVTAHMWYNIASANGHEDAGEWRDMRAGLMTASEITEATAMARECMNSNYKNCGS
ncbi:sel1 repeat family protein, partial [Amylibacter sp.]|nr:sel1 repeat family protein [Amylibacter sp.]